MFEKRIGITQRVMRHNRHNEVMDCLDINWAKLLTSLNILPIPLPLLQGDAISDAWEMLKLNGLILSGGNTLAEYADETDAPESISTDRDAYEKLLLKAALSTRTPILGVCRGLQVINQHYDGRLRKVKGHAGTRHRLITESSATEFKFPLKVNSFHDCAISRNDLGKELIALAHDTEDNIEAAYHPQDKILGVMWHPERESSSLPMDCELIKGHFGL